jgi:hypothetical protein
MANAGYRVAVLEMNETEVKARAVGLEVVRLEIGELNILRTRWRVSRAAPALFTPVPTRL